MFVCFTSVALCCAVDTSISTNHTSFFGVAMGKPLNAIIQLPPAKDLRDLGRTILCTFKVGDKAIEILAHTD